MEENIDILDYLKKIVLNNTRSFREDFQHDVKKLTAAVQGQNEEERSFLWLSRPCGIWCLTERSVFFKDSTEHTIWMFYEHEASTIQACRVVVTGQDNGKPIGNIYPIDYKSQVQRIKRNAVQAEAVTLTFADGQTITFPYAEVEGRFGHIKDKYGTIEKIHYIAEDESELKAVISSELRQLEQTPQQKPPRRPANRKARSKTVRSER